MLRLKPVKTLLSTSLLISLSLFSVKAISKEIDNASIHPIFECGDYVARGFLSLSKKHFFILSMRYGTRLPYELILLGGNEKEKLDLVGRYVEALIYVPKKISDNSRPMAFLQKVSRSSNKTNEQEFIKARKCEDPSRYLDIK